VISDVDKQKIMELLNEIVPGRETKTHLRNSCSDFHLTFPIMDLTNYSGLQEEKIKSIAPVFHHVFGIGERGRNPTE